ncbi:phytoene desaturase family protein [Micromonospora olivasterospora]|uniref:Pyridine nucleotide-disulfide oxidoreductase domain-containing protein 2 n=1 Tax=Micromonospora olivasterospora TaxID=1880 RepID=A0A562IC23_MICOL|nr:NAD(P)/FAD-dependent oxidoreductase [Micromonospora olivasterospora]TWH68589.1 phytoene dehydrogenase-like protein [Micromonospora olivasterospora]
MTARQEPPPAEADDPDVVIVGSGHNGLAAAVLLSRAGLRVTVYEAAEEAGGGARTVETMGRGIWHDICSSVHPMGLASPFFAAFDLAAHGVTMLQPEAAYAHPLDGGRAGMAWTDLDRTVAGLGGDGRAWRQIFAPLVRDWREIAATVMSDLRNPLRGLSPATVRFGLRAALLGRRHLPARLHDTVAGAMLTGVNLHGVVRPDALAPTAVGLTLALLAHAVGWPIPQGGSRSIVEALVADLRRHGGRLHTGHRVDDVRELPPARAVILNLGPAGVTRVAGAVLPDRYRRRLRRYRYGPGACKIDFLLADPVPWDNPECRRAGTLHLVGGRAEALAAARQVNAGSHADRPYVLAVQPGVVDYGRAPAGLHVLSTYCHVPHGSPVDAGDIVTAQIERFASGFRGTVLDRRVRTARDLARYNENYVGGDIMSGRLTLLQTVRRPRPGLHPYATPMPWLYHCSAASPPGPGIHGMAGYHVARRVLRERFGFEADPLTLLRREATKIDAANGENGRR